MGGATRSIRCLLFMTRHKQTVHSVLRYDPLFYLIALNGCFPIRFYWLHSLRLWTLLGVLLYCTERLDWVEGSAFSRFVTGGKDESLKHITDILTSKKAPWSTG